MFDAPARAASSGSTNLALSVAAPPFLCQPAFGHAMFAAPSIQPPLDLSPPTHKKRRVMQSTLSTPQSSVDLSPKPTPPRVARSTLDNSQASVALDLSPQPTPPRALMSNLDNSQASADELIELE